VIEELCRGWMSLAGVINSHTMMALIVSTHGTDEQRRRFLPRFARGDLGGVSASPSRTRVRTFRPSARARAATASTTS